MARTTPDFHSSTARVAARATLRRIAASAAEQTGRGPQRVLETLVAAQLRKEYRDDHSMLAGAVAFELGLHQQDQLREVTSQVMELLAL